MRIKKRPNRSLSSVEKATEDTSNSSESENEFEVEKVLDKKTLRNGKIKYLLKWVGYPDSDNLWVPIEDTYCPELIEEYEKNAMAKLQENKAKIKDRPKPRMSLRPKKNVRKGISEKRKEISEKELFGDVSSSDSDDFFSDATAAKFRLKKKVKSKSLNEKSKESNDKDAISPNKEKSQDEAKFLKEETKEKKGSFEQTVEEETVTESNENGYPTSEKETNDECSEIFSSPISSINVTFRKISKTEKEKNLEKIIEKIKVRHSLKSDSEDDEHVLTIDLDAKEEEEEVDQNDSGNLSMESTLALSSLENFLNENDKKTPLNNVSYFICRKSPN